ncbi:D(4) dopamine receptor isoform X2 [Rhinolophus ferrumequinum]|uniref:D(4) dopamine receptor isoform X2 n=1 Tax=Rhinolophus ferrumequinum TaxID=59479 RepID=UPI00140F7CFA|nr:D(4) dopamine receptor isoform X2 [Rhinolophus ferrumequinum]
MEMAALQGHLGSPGALVPDSRLILERLPAARERPLGPGRSVAAEPRPLRRAHGHGRHAVHRLHLQPVRNQRGQVGRPPPGPAPLAAWPRPSPPGPAPRPGPPPHSTPRRFVAVAVPLRYNSQSWGGRQLLLIGATWLLSAAVAAPLLCGLNDARGRDPAVCRLENRDYVVYSSLCSFFLPCPLMLLLYWATFRGLRRWEAARRTKLHGRAPRRPSGPGPPPAEALAPPEATRAEHARRRRGVQITGQERKAMRVLPMVVGAFLVCWTPFFVVHVTGALCPACAVPPRLVSAVTWLGYVNSAINPVIYTAFNAEFRTVFRKALRLCC